MSVTIKKVSSSAELKKFIRFNYELYGGTPILGVNKPAIVGHGISSALAIQNMILQSRDIVNANLSENLKKMLSK